MSVTFVTQEVNSHVGAMSEEPPIEGQMQKATAGEVSGKDNRRFLHGCKQAVGAEHEWKNPEERDLVASEHAWRQPKSNGVASDALGMRHHSTSPNYCQNCQNSGSTCGVGKGTMERHDSMAGG